jgi:hypothetical protein
VSIPFERVVAAEIAAEEQLRAIPEWMWDGESLPVPVAKIADSHYGMLIRESDDLAGLAGVPSGTHISGLLFPAVREIWIDAVEAERAPARRRFTIGHELGHWVLHCNLGRSGAVMVQCRTESVTDEGAVEAGAAGLHLAEATHYPPTEIDANQFAAAMLMPRALVEKEHAWVEGDVRRLAEAFGVSTVAMERRLWFLAASASR